MSTRGWFAHVLGHWHVHPKHPLTAQRPENLRAIFMILSEQIRRELEKIAERQDWSISFAGAWSEVRGLAQEHHTGVVVIDRESCQGDWKEDLRALLQPAQRCCAILVDSSGFGRFSIEFLREGGYGVLTTPLEEARVTHTVRCAWAFWKHCISPVLRS